MKFKKGDKVKMINCGEAEFYKDRVWECDGDSWIDTKNQNNQELVFLHGFSGSFLCKCLEKHD